MTTFPHTLCLQTLEGKLLTRETFDNKVILIVNTASLCGFASQLYELEQLWQQYRNEGLLVIGCPCNQFGSQEPHTPDWIQQHLKEKYGVSFPVTEPLLVNGPQAHPLYHWLTQEKPGIFNTKSIKWNFTKFLVSRSGHVVGRYGPNQHKKSYETQIIKELHKLH